VFCVTSVINSSGRNVLGIKYQDKINFRGER